MRFDEYGLSESLVRAVRELGFEQPTHVQEEAIPEILRGRDVLGTAQTGTGKTVAFLLPSMQRMLSAQASRRPRMVVVAPTRELAMQIADEAGRLARHTGLQTAAIYGGAPLAAQARSLRRGIDLVVATPGRLMDHMQRGNVRVDGVEILVLDEADRMLDMGFLPDIEAIVERMPRERQTLMFSATMPQAIHSLSYRFLREPVRIELNTARPPDTIAQRIYPVPKHLKAPLLTALLKGQDVDSALVFTRTKQEADYVTRKLREAGLQAAEIHGDFSQKERVEALERFRAGKARVLVATNVAARGLDIEGISHVINYDVPDEPEDYVHRVGRTARVEAAGTAWTLVTVEDEGLIASIEHLLGAPIERVQLPGFDYAVPTPDWARPSAKALLQSARRNQSSIARWKAMTR